jgi:hypothetical protein
LPKDLSGTRRPGEEEESAAPPNYGRQPGTASPSFVLSPYDSK